MTPEERYRYKTQGWGGLPQWACPACPFDSVDAAAFDEHVESHFQALRRQPHAPGAVLDFRGRPIETSTDEPRETRAQEE